eukprot:TRINITY_DN4205_c0_g1_i1.p1 TRINITY_DN4205_c0_g1~~TRINITY_DN4205_c0_g1_i1.p1  ORF type:complete len:1061 (-),score=350.29 TRINITY_DN4205_c0_g1_i1:134-3316(-)
MSTFNHIPECGIHKDHDHILQKNDKSSGWNCDICSKHNPNGGRWRCTKGCDYDLCVECWTGYFTPKDEFDINSIEGKQVKEAKSSTKAKDLGLTMVKQLLNQSIWKAMNENALMSFMEKTMKYLQFNGTASFHSEAYNIPSANEIDPSKYKFSSKHSDSKHDIKCLTDGSIDSSSYESTYWSTEPNVGGDVLEIKFNEPTDVSILEFFWKRGRVPITLGVRGSLDGKTVFDQELKHPLGSNDQNEEKYMFKLYLPKTPLVDHISLSMKGFTTQNVQCAFSLYHMKIGSCPRQDPTAKNSLRESLLHFFEEIAKSDKSYDARKLALKNMLQFLLDLGSAEGLMEIASECLDGSFMDNWENQEMLAEVFSDFMKTLSEYVDSILVPSTGFSPATTSGFQWVYQHNMGTATAEGLVASNNADALAILDNPIHTGKAEVSIKLVRDSRDSECSCFGFSKTDSPSAHNYEGNPNLYMYRAYNGKIYQPGGSDIEITKFHPDDIVTFKVEVATKEIFAKVNDGDYELAFENVEFPVYPCIQFYGSSPSAKVESINTHDMGKAISSFNIDDQKIGFGELGIGCSGVAEERLYHSTISSAEDEERVMCMHSKGKTPSYVKFKFQNYFSTVLDSVDSKKKDELAFWILGSASLNIVPPHDAAKQTGAKFSIKNDEGEVLWSAIVKKPTQDPHFCVKIPRSATGVTLEVESLDDETTPSCLWKQLVMQAFPEDDSFANLMWRRCKSSDNNRFESCEDLARSFGVSLLSELNVLGETTLTKEAGEGSSVASMPFIAPIAVDSVKTMVYTLDYLKGNKQTNNDWCSQVLSVIGVIRVALKAETSVTGCSEELMSELLKLKDFLQDLMINSDNEKLSSAAELAFCDGLTIFHPETVDCLSTVSNLYFSEGGSILFKFPSPFVPSYDKKKTIDEPDTGLESLALMIETEAHLNGTNVRVLRQSECGLFLLLEISQEVAKSGKTFEKFLNETIVKHVNEAEYSWEFPRGMIKPKFDMSLQRSLDADMLAPSTKKTNEAGCVIFTSSNFSSSFEAVKEVIIASRNAKKAAKEEDKE